LILALWETSRRCWNWCKHCFLQWDKFDLMSTPYFFNFFNATLVHCDYALIHWIKVKCQCISRLINRILVYLKRMDLISIK
jgi:hypothetical protein